MIDAAGFGLQAIPQSGIGDIAHEGRPLARKIERGQAGFIAIDQHQPRHAALREPGGRRRADARGRARDKGGAPIEPEIVCHPQGDTERAGPCRRQAALSMPRSLSLR